MPDPCMARRLPGAILWPRAARTAMAAMRFSLCKDPRSPVAPSRIPYLCGKCHQEGTPVQRQREIHESNIIENYSESMHGAALLQKGLIVTATCVSCHTAHQILPHTDARSSIARQNIAATCTKCHAQIEAVHRKVIKGELWEKELHVLPACVDCHQPHKVRKVFYDQGMSNPDCLRCHERTEIKAAKDGRSLYVDESELSHSMHVKQACSQCHIGVTPSRLRPCETITQKVDCGSCHVRSRAAISAEHARAALRQERQPMPPPAWNATAPTAPAERRIRRR